MSGQKAAPARAFFGQNFVTAIAIKTNRGGADQHLRLGIGMRERSGQRTRAQHTAVTNRILLGRRPASYHALSREVNRGVKAGDRAGRQTCAWRFGRRIPRNFSRPARRAANLAVIDALARDIARRIEGEMSYPGIIKVTVVRETRSVDYAK